MKFISQTFLDRASIATSTLCAIHCAFMPILISLSPMFAKVFSNGHIIHETMVLVTVPLSLMAAFIGCSKHKDILVFSGIITGLILLVASAYIAHDFVGEMGEKIMTMSAAGLLILAHWRNYTQCRKTSCSH